MWHMILALLSLIVFNNLSRGGGLLDVSGILNWLSDLGLYIFLNTLR